MPDDSDALAASDDDIALDAGSTAEDSSTCPYCSGSGEGPYEGTRCSACRGWGVLNDA